LLKMWTEDVAEVYVYQQPVGAEQHVFKVAVADTEEVGHHTVPRTALHIVVHHLLCEVE